MNYLQKRYLGEDVAIAFVYCDYKEGRTSSELVASLARQLAARKAPLPQRLVDLYERLGRGDNHLDRQQLESLFLSLCSDFNRTFVLIDALDECNIATERSSLLSIIQALQDASVKSLITSRPNLEDINMQFDQALRVEIVAKESDVKAYLMGKVMANPVFAKRISSAPGLEKNIVETITSRASGM